MLDVLAGFNNAQLSSIKAGLFVARHMKPLRILMVSQYWNPEPSFMALPFARELIKRGHTIEVLTGFPCYPGGKIYPGYRQKPFSREVIEGIRVNRVWLYPSHDTSARRRIMYYLTFAFSAVCWGPWITKRADVSYVDQRPPPAALPARWISLLKRTPVDYDIQDLWPDFVTQTGMMPKRLEGMLNRYCNWVHKKMDRLIALSPGFKRTLIDRGVKESKIDVIFNWCDEAALKPVPANKDVKKELGLEGAFVVLFAGTMGIFQKIDSAVEAAKILQSDCNNIHFVFVGGGVEAARIEASAREIPNVHFLPRRPTEEMPKLLAAADALLVHLQDDPIFEITVPSKTQAYLYSGRPIVMGIRGDAADIVREAQAGVLCEPENPQSMADAVKRLAEMSPEDREQLGKNGHAFYEMKMSVRVGVDLFDASFRRAVEDRARPKR